MKYFLGILTFLIRLLLACDLHAQIHYAIQGRVTANPSNVPLYMAIVELTDTNDSNLEFYTDTNGYYYIDSSYIKPLTSYTLSVVPYYLSYWPADTAPDSFTTTSPVRKAIINFRTFPRGFYGDNIGYPNIYFKCLRTTIQQSTKITSLSWLVKYMNVWPSIVIEADGNSSQDEGGAAQKLSLSLARAVACKDYLVSQGIDSMRIVVKGWGDKRPLIDRKSIRRMKSKVEKDAAYSVNQRVAFHNIRFDYKKQ